MSSESKKERRARIGIVTNKMPDEVYEQLNSKAQKNQLTQYIIELVQRDLNNQTVQLDFVSLTKEIQSLQQEFKKIQKVYIYDGEPKEIAIGKLEEAADNEVNQSGLSEGASLDF